MRCPSMQSLCIALASVAVAVVLSPAAASAQDISATPVYGTLNLSAGFSPDPQERSLSAGGSHQTSLGGCDAYIYSAAPDYDLNYQAGSLPLIISATSDSDVLLLVNTPDGRWHCDDDSGEGLDPMLTFSSPQSGNYNIWVGTYSNRSGNLPAARLLISELSGGASSSNGNGSSPVSLNFGARPTYTTFNLNSGFTPDPTRHTVRAGGRDEVPSDLGSYCRGYVNAAAPDVDVNYSAGGYPLNIYARSSSDVTLIINQPDGSWICNDDANGTNPHVRIEKPMSGNYNIWIGTYRQSTSSLPESTLYISELSPDW